MMQTIASYLCRGIEAVITGLTRNQFVDNTTRGFESLPLRQKEPKSNTVFGLGSFSHRGGHEASLAKRDEGFAYRRYTANFKEQSICGICVARRC